jgi:hypothetical protein
MSGTRSRGLWIPVAALAGAAVALWMRPVAPQVRAQTAAAAAAIAHHEPAAPVGEATARRVPPSNRPSSDLGVDRADVIGSLDPTSKNYDPFTVQRATGRPIREILEAEPRDSTFAGPREVALRERIAERLHKRTNLQAVVDVACRTSTCEVTVAATASDAELNDAIQALDMMDIADGMQIGSSRDPDHPERNTIRMILPFTAAQRDHTAYDRQLRQHEARDAQPAPRP